VASALLAGYLLGFTVAASPGPIALLCVRRTLARGWPEGLASGFGVATADATYAALAAFGVAALTTALVSGRRWLALAGGLALILIGLRGMLAKATGEAREASTTRTGLLGAYASTAGLTMANPQTILTFAALFGSLPGLGATFAARAPALLVAGTLAGSATWWVLLTGAAALARRRLDPRLLRLVRTASGLLVAAFGVAAIASAFIGR
jgi:threonine/homoserine/homoserine lactone efflux protein